MRPCPKAPAYIRWRALAKQRVRQALAHGGPASAHRAVKVRLLRVDALQTPAPQAVYRRPGRRRPLRRRVPQQLHHLPRAAQQPQLVCQPKVACAREAKTGRKSPLGADMAIVKRFGDGKKNTAARQHSAPVRAHHHIADLYISNIALRLVGHESVDCLADQVKPCRYWIECHHHLPLFIIAASSRARFPT